MAKYAYAFGVFLAFFLASCSNYSDVLKSDNYPAKFVMADSLYSHGSQAKIKYRKNQKRIDKKGPIKKEKYHKTDLNHAIALYEQIYQKSSKTAEGELAYFRIGKAYYFVGDYYMAGYFLGMFPRRFPESVKAEEALFMSSLCAVKNSPTHDLDQDETEIAINELQNFIDRYPNSELVDSCNRTIDRLKYKIELKDYDAVKLYAKTENYRAAFTSAESFVETYPRSKHVEEIWYLRVRNAYLFAKVSVDNKKKERYEETMESYRNFVSLFPESDYLNELKGYEVKATQELSELKDKK